MMSDSERNFFRPKWRRIAVTVFCAAWSILEWVSNEPIWAMISAGIAFYCFWNFLYKFEEHDTPEE